MKKLIFTIPVLVFCYFIFTGQDTQDSPKKWVLDPIPSYIVDPNVKETPPLPRQDNYIHPNTQTRVVTTSNGTLSIAPSYRVLPRPSTTQSEVIIVRNPINQNILFGSSNAVSFGPLFISEGVYVTTNGGVSWYGSDTLNGSPINNHGGDPGPTIDKNGVFHMTHLGYTSSGMFANYSTNNGLTWSSNYTIQSGIVDKNLAGTDNAPASPFYGRSYCVYTTWGSGYPARISYTTNYGVSWSSPTTIISPLSGYVARGEDVNVGPNGDVYVCWANTVGNGPEDWLSFAKSTDGGVSFSGSNNAVDMNGILCFGACFGSYGIRMNSFPRIDVDKTGGSRNGWIYVCASQRNLAPAGSDADIVMWRSTNGGSSWSSGVRVNQDPINNGKLQFYNAIRVDELGGVNIVYYSNRNTAADSAEVMLARSTDGGTTWTETVVSDHRFRPKSIPGLASGYGGDYIGVTSGNGKIWPLWMDDFSGIYQAWTAPVTIGPPPTNDIAVGPFLSLPSQFIVNTGYTIRTKVSNLGTANQTGVPIRWFINNSLTNTTNINLNAGAVDSVSNTWTPTATGSYTLMYVSALGTDENRYNDTVRTTVTVLPSVPQVQTTTICRNGLNKNITDYSTIRDTINFSNANAISVLDVNVKVDTVTHTWDGDLQFTLSHLGTTVALITSRGSSGDNFINTRLNDSAANPISSGTAPFNGEYRPESPLSAFNTSNPNGTWILSISDNAGGDTGYLKAWCITLTYQIITGGIETIEIPNYYSLSQNYPNPFNPVTNIRFTLPRAEHVKLTVYDVLGREVKVLINEFRNVGVYNLNFDASGLASGIYFYRIETANFTDVKRMMVVK